MPMTATPLNRRIAGSLPGLATVFAAWTPPPIRDGKWDSRPSWDDRSKFDNRPSWDNWNKRR